MKSERRHDLQTNSLAKGIEGLPDYWREYGNKVLLVVIVALIAYLAVRYWKDKKENEARQLTASLETVRVQLGNLDQLQMQYFGGQPATIADARNRITNEANDAISNLLSTARDPKIVARAYVAQGDLDWKLANMPELPGAATRPELKVGNRDGLLNAAREAYAKVLDPPYSGNVLDVFAARMGIAAVAENQGKFDEAKAQYQAIADAGNLPAAFKEVASGRLKELPGISKPALLVPPPEVSPTASTVPSIMGPEAPPVTLPTTLPAGTTLPTDIGAATTGPAPASLPPTPSSQPATTQSQ